MRSLDYCIAKEDELIKERERRIIHEVGTNTNATTYNLETLKKINNDTSRTKRINIKLIN